MTYALFTAWTHARPDQRPAHWAAMRPHIGPLMVEHRRDIARHISPTEMRDLLASPDRDAFLVHLTGTIGTWLLMAGDSAPALALELCAAPWGSAGDPPAPFEAPREWRGTPIEARHLLSVLLAHGLDMQALAWAQRLPFAPAPHAPTPLLTGRTPGYARWALGCPATGEGATAVRPDAVATAVAHHTHWIPAHTGLLTLVWARGLSPAGWVRVRADQHPGLGRLEHCTLHARIRFLAQIGCPYSATPNPEALAALFG